MTTKKSEKECGYGHRLTNHCSGCTDSKSEGTHQGCTIEHGHVGCSLSPQSAQPPAEGWEKEFDVNFCHIAMTRRGFEENRLDFSDAEPIKSFIRSLLSTSTKAAKEEERAKIIREDLKGERNRVIHMIRTEEQIKERERVIEILEGMINVKDFTVFFEHSENYTPENYVAAGFKTAIDRAMKAITSIDK